MAAKDKAKHILLELKGHAPFTLLGVILGIGFMLLFRNASYNTSHILFAVFHPAHVVLSAMVTAAMFRIHALRRKFLTVLLIGYFGSIGIATISDIIIPHIGSRLLGLDIPTHAQIHPHEDDHEHAEKRQNHDSEHNEIQKETCMHFGFIEEWYIVNPAAVLGVLIAFFLPRTKFPHSAHVLISTWASSSYLLMSIRSEITIAAAIGIFGTLFIATWLPCCVSDIVFPLLFVRSDVQLAGPCPDHARHSHPHLPKDSEASR